MLILNISTSDTFLFERELRAILEILEHVCGRSPAFTDIFQLKPYYELSKVAADYGCDRKDRIRDIESALIPYYFTLIVENALVGFAHPALRQLREYDAAHGSRLYHTLEAFLQCERNYVKTAKALFIHRSTLLYRIDKIAKLTDIDFESPETRFHIMMSFRLERFVSAGNNILGSC